MSSPDTASIRLHDDAPLFREAVAYTAAETGFSGRLIEKDYFCTLLLQQIAADRCGLVFKGGTCVAKVHAGFYRLSEDLDFAIPAPIYASRANRRQRAAAVKRSMTALTEEFGDFTILTPLTGANECSQYNAVLGYTSLLGDQQESIRIEVSLREPLLRPAMRHQARTLLLDPVTGSAAIPLIAVRCVSRDEAMAEKLRAALSRRDAAIRDFYDIDYAVRRLGLDVLAPDLAGLVKQKLTVPGQEPVDVSADRLAALRLQVDAQLRPVLRARDFAEFDLDRAFAIVAAVAALLG